MVIECVDATHCLTVSRQLHGDLGYLVIASVAVAFLLSAIQFWLGARGRGEKPRP